jgi:4-amino-4-deoxy-L-arabinose transferase-like glycosyltransferase
MSFNALIARLREMSVFRLSLLIGALVVLPRLGSVGLWDPWETHYAEVGRQMLARGDLVHPYWQNAWFFSKPPLTPWLAALGLWLSGAQPWGQPGEGALPPGTEWMIRLPFALVMLAAGALLADTVARKSSRRAGVFAALVWWTMPLIDFIARQTMTDGPFVASLVIAMCCAARAEHEGATQYWWAGFFGALGAGLLAKGLVALLPLVIGGLCWLTLDGTSALSRLRRIPWWSPLFLLLSAGPWYWVMVRFEGRDDEGKTFVERFFIADHLDRFATGVHTTTPGGTFTYFLEQGAWAIFPWVVLVPVALHALVSMPREGTRWRLAVTWSIAGALFFTLFTLSATRFHHYVLPMLPPLVVLIALGADALWDDARRFAPSLLAGLVALLVVSKDLAARPRHLLDLFTYNHDRPYPMELLGAPVWSGAPGWLTPGHALMLLTSLVGVGIFISIVMRSGRRVVLATSAMAVAFALFLSWQHWEALGKHWTQRRLVDVYLQARAPGEPLAAFLMNWKGETFYTRNDVVQIGAADPRGSLAMLLSSHPRAFFLVEHHRLEMLRGALPPNTTLEPIAPQTMNKFVLAVAHRGP